MSERISQNPTEQQGVLERFIPDNRLVATVAAAAIAASLASGEAVSQAETNPTANASQDTAYVPAPNIFTLIQNAQNEIQQKAQPLDSGEQVKLDSPKMAIKDMLMDSSQDEMQKAKISPKVGSSKLKVTLAQLDTMNKYRLGHTEVVQHFPSGNGGPGHDIATTKDEFFYLVSPDLVRRKTETVQAGVYSGKKWRPLGKSSSTTVKDNFGVVPEDSSFAHKYKKLAGESTKYGRTSSSKYSLKMNKPLSRATLKKGVYLKVVQSWASRDKIGFGKAKGTYTKILGPFKKAGQVKKTPITDRYKIVER